jgi:hypothetical protein
LFLSSFLNSFLIFCQILNNRQYSMQKLPRESESNIQSGNKITSSGCYFSKRINLLFIVIVKQHIRCWKERIWNSPLSSKE